MTLPSPPSPPRSGRQEVAALVPPPPPPRKACGTSDVRIFATSKSLPAEPHRAELPSQSAAPLPPPPPSSHDTERLSRVGHKGYGKGNYGDPLPVPTLIPPPPPASLVGTSPEDAASAEARENEEVSEMLPPGCPMPRQASAAQIERWVSENYKPLENVATDTPPRPGEHILWRGFKRGKRGGASTADEYFNGHVSSVVQEENEYYVYVN